MTITFLDLNVYFAAQYVQVGHYFNLIVVKLTLSPQKQSRVTAVVANDYNSSSVQLRYYSFQEASIALL